MPSTSKYDDAYKVNYDFELWKDGEIFTVSKYFLYS